MCARRITELECTLENERIGIRRQMLIKQIWRLRSRLEQESATLDGLDEQPTRSLSTLSTQRRTKLANAHGRPEVPVSTGSEVYCR